MKKEKQRMVFGLVVMCLIFISAGPAGAISINFNPSYDEIMGGESFEMDIIISGLDEVNVKFFEFDLVFDDAILDFTLYTLTDQLGEIAVYNAFDTSSGDLGGGLINIGLLSMLDNLTFQNDSFKLATLSFTGAAKGISDFSISNYTLWDEFGQDVGASVKKSASVYVDPVPEPSTYILLGCGLLGFIGFRKRIVRC